ncbi:hypothetical protein [Methylobacterium marchantiae]|uniref:Flagellar basal-body/hook protein C-terminal domain-containing protein n=1 Tax=Methylobacterium marchantiae TaxID=600331 RepID=A0ABW3X1G1_9HYPH|nr:hypothetical protein AIGOOFII_0282 [Methylobacterium marchantiae]
MISATSISSGGMAVAAQRFSSAAESIATLGTSLPSPTQVDLSSSAVRLIESKAEFGINAAVLKSSLDTDRRVLDILV